MEPARQPEQIPDNASLDEALGATVRNAGKAAANAAQLDALEADIRQKAEVSR